MAFTDALDIIMIIEPDLFYLIIIHSMHDTVTTGLLLKRKRISFNQNSRVHVVEWVTTRDRYWKPIWAETIHMYI